MADVQGRAKEATPKFNRKGTGFVAKAELPADEDEEEAVVPSSRLEPASIGSIVQARPAMKDFRGEFCVHLARLEHYVMAEMQKFEGAILALQEENSCLRSQYTKDSAQDEDNREGFVPVKEPLVNLMAAKGVTDVSIENADTALREDEATSLPQPQPQPEPGTRSSRLSFSARSSHEWAMRVKEQTTQVDKLKRGISGSSLYKSSGLASRIVKSGLFENFTLFVVTANAIWIGFDIDYNEKSLGEADLGFQIGEYTFCAVFTMEILVRFLAFQQKFSGFTDGWFIFDSSVTTLMWIDIIVSLAVGSSGGGIISAFRLLRLARLTRVTKLASLLPELGTLVKGIVAGIRSVAIAVAVLIGITYTFAILMRAMSIDTVADSVFPSVPHSMYILLQQGMGPDNAAMMDELGQARWYLAFFFAVFLFLSAITIMNMLIGILVEVMGKVTLSERERSDLAQMSEKLQAMLQAIDENYDNLVSREEFQKILDYQDAVSILQEVGVDVYALVEDVDSIFEHGFERKLPFKELLEVIMSFRPTNNAVIRSISKLRGNIRNNANVINKRLDSLDNINKRLDNLDNINKRLDNVEFINTRLDNLELSVRTATQCKIATI